MKRPHLTKGEILPTLISHEEVESAVDKVIKTTLLQRLGPIFLGLGLALELVLLFVIFSHLLGKL